MGAELADHLLVSFAFYFVMRTYSGVQSREWWYVTFVQKITLATETINC